MLNARRLALVGTISPVIATLALSGAIKQAGGIIGVGQHGHLE